MSNTYGDTTEEPTVFADGNTTYATGVVAYDADGNPASTTGATIKSWTIDAPAQDATATKRNTTQFRISAEEDGTAKISAIVEAGGETFTLTKDVPYSVAKAKATTVVLKDADGKDLDPEETVAINVRPVQRATNYGDTGVKYYVVDQYGRNININPDQNPTAFVVTSHKDANGDPAADLTATVGYIQGFYGKLLISPYADFAADDTFNVNVNIDGLTSTVKFYVESKVESN